MTVSQAEHEEAVHAARGWKPESERPEVDPQAQKELDELWKKLYPKSEKNSGTEENETSSNDT